jgi:hypothetical protein
MHSEKFLNHAYAKYHECVSSITGGKKQKSYKVVQLIMDVIDATSAQDDYSLESSGNRIKQINEIVKAYKDKLKKDFLARNNSTDSVDDVNKKWEKYENITGYSALDIRLCSKVTKLFWKIYLEEIGNLVGKLRDSSK